MILIFDRIVLKMDKIMSLYITNSYITIQSKKGPLIV